MAHRPSGGRRGRPGRPPKGSKGRSRRSSNSNPPAETTPRHFFRVILPDVIEAKKLRIPLRLFVKRLGVELSETARLSLPNGQFWKVRVKKDEENIWFMDGWSKFVKDNSIRDSYLLSFEYKGNSIFQVIIFDPSTFEIAEYGNNEATSGDGDNGNDDGEDSVSRKEKSTHIRKNPPESSVLGAKRVANFMQRSNQNKKPKIEKEEEEVVAFSEDENDCRRPGKLKKNEIPCSSKDKNEKNKIVEVYCSEQYKHLSGKVSDGSKKAIQAADMFKTTHPAFKVILRAHNFSQSNLYVPDSFSSKYMNRFLEKIKLLSQDGMKWSVKVRKCYYGFYFGKGWNAFQKHIKLKEGDVLLFELINSKDFLLKVTVFRS